MAAAEATRRNSTGAAARQRVRSSVSIDAVRQHGSLGGTRKVSALVLSPRRGGDIGWAPRAAARKGPVSSRDVSRTNPSRSGFGRACSSSFIFGRGWHHAAWGEKERKKQNGQPKGGMGGRHAATWGEGASLWERENLLSR